MQDEHYIGYIKILLKILLLFSPNNSVVFYLKTLLGFAFLEPWTMALSYSLRRFQDYRKASRSFCVSFKEKRKSWSWVNNSRQDTWLQTAGSERTNPLKTRKSSTKTLANRVSTQSVVNVEGERPLWLQKQKIRLYVHLTDDLSFQLPASPRFAFRLFPSPWGFLPECWTLTSFQLGFSILVSQLK